MQFNIPAEYKNAPGVYIIRNNVNSKVYVGSSVMLKRRFKTHRSKLMLGYHNNRYLQGFVNKHGIDCMSFELVELARPGDLDHLAELEQHYISFHDSANRKRGFNLVPVVFPRVQHSEQTKQKMSVLSIARGISPQQRARMIQGLLAAGAPWNKGMTNKVSATCAECGKGFERRPSHNASFCSRACWRAHPLTDDTCQRLRSMNIGVKKSASAIQKRSNTVAAKMLEKHGRNCQTCGNIFAPKNGKAGQKFCSRKCWNERTVSQETRAKHAANMAHLHSSEAREKAYETRKAGKGWVHGPEQVAKRLATIAVKTIPQQLNIF